MNSRRFGMFDSLKKDLSILERSFFFMLQPILFQRVRFQQILLWAFPV